MQDCKVLSYPAAQIQPHSNDAISGKKREITSERSQELKVELYKFYKGLLLDLLKRDASGKLKVFNHPKLLLGFSDIQILQVIAHAPKISTIDDICCYVEIWDLKHAHSVYQIMQKLFGDTEGSTDAPVDEISSDEEDCLLPDDWSDLGLDEELALMAIDELNFLQMSGLNDSLGCSTNDVDIPYEAINALMNLSFDAVLEN